MRTNDIRDPIAARTAAAALPEGHGFPLTLPPAEDPDEALLFDFDAVPRQRRRRNGWTEETQRLFIALLGKCGCVARAARAVGMAPRSAYRLRDAPGADGFAEAWDVAWQLGLDRVRAAAMDRAMNGALVPVYRRGKLVRVEHRHCDRLALALLAGRDRDVEDSRRSVVERRKYWALVHARDARLAAEQREREEDWARCQAIMDQAEEDKRLRRARTDPRVVRF